MFSRFFSKRLDFVIAFCITGVSMKTMDTELTRKQQEKQQQTSDHRIACSDDHAGSIAPPQTSPGVGSSGSAVRIVSNRKVLAGGGRRSAYRRGVPIEVGAKDPNLDRDSADDRRRFHQGSRARRRGHRHYAIGSGWSRRQRKRSPASRSEATARTSGEILAIKLPRLGSRIYGSSVQRACWAGETVGSLGDRSRHSIDATTFRIARVI